MMLIKKKVQYNMQKTKNITGFTWTFPAIKKNVPHFFLFYNVLGLSRFWCCEFSFSLLLSSSFHFRPYVVSSLLGLYVSKEIQQFGFHFNFWNWNYRFVRLFWLRIFFWQILVRGGYFAIQPLIRENLFQIANSFNFLLNTSPSFLFFTSYMVLLLLW